MTIQNPDDDARLMLTGSATSGPVACGLELAAPLTASKGPLSPEHLLHELRVHQAELEMQNEELRRTQQALEESRDRYVDLYEFAPVGYLTLSSTGTIAEINLTGAAMLGVERGNLISRRFTTFVAAAEQDRWHRHLVHALHHPGRQECELTLSHADGTQFSAHLDCLRQERDSVPVLRVALADISIRKQAEAELVRTREILQHTNERLLASNRDLEQFAYVASHDLQEPLRMVVSYSQLLEKKYQHLLDDDAHTFIHFMVDGGMRMQAMILDLLEFSRVDRIGGERELVNSGNAVDEALLSLTQAITEAGAEASHTELPDILYVRHQFIRLMQNLIGNAVKYRHSARPPKVVVSARRDGAAWVFSVTDNGIGIESTYSERIFTIFQRLHTRDKYSGTGIGLAVCKKIVEHHGGRIWVESHPGIGSTFLFTVPDP
ncbi:PAS/PAC sensor signal transduction histidine kinase [Magnetospirillum gryphiswaldense MSR-1 v2]|uniref:histidine kinase n=1 Tax=Magnetospirillum gryphiswaldense (strain DSM 6361 / JCM 21280 / NBRC 15271 / MSR-1) TaxID=431944 RepID=V6F049_MAGGM|nr:ATP-binding protein [Magnetospirillum gryphiswaldense]CDK98870.1 PAS/PAC sensor signal transduction histidine kinase [Magnetospirillum gryphiswaldense MSR-1 v2]